MTDDDTPRPQLHHVNFLTTRLDEMIEWYGVVLGMEVVFRFPLGAWITNDEANHRIALTTPPGLVRDPDKGAHDRLHHTAFEHASFDDLDADYVRLREAGIVPRACLDHGMTLSYYYADPELQLRRAAGRRLRRLAALEGVDGDVARVRGEPDRRGGRSREGVGGACRGRGSRGHPAPHLEDGRLPPRRAARPRRSGAAPGRPAASAQVVSADARRRSSRRPRARGARAAGPPARGRTF